MRNRIVIHRVHGDTRRRTRRAAVAVADLIGKAVGPVVIRVRRIVEGPVRIQRQAAMCRTRQNRNRQRIAIHIRVIVQNTRRRDRQNAVLIHHIALVLRNRCGVGRTINGDRDGTRVRSTIPVRNRVGEGVDSEKASVRRIGEHATCSLDHGATASLREPGDRDGVAINIGVIAKNGNPGRGRVELGSCSIRASHRIIVDPMHGDRAIGRSSQRGPRLGDDIGKVQHLAFADAKVLVATIGVEGQATIRPDCQDPTPRKHHRCADKGGIAIHRGDGKRVAFGVKVDPVSIVGENTCQGDGRIFINVKGIILGHNVVIKTRDREVHRCC